MHLNIRKKYNIQFIESSRFKCGIYKTNEVQRALVSLSDFEPPSIYLRTRFFIRYWTSLGL